LARGRLYSDIQVHLWTCASIIPECLLTHAFVVTKFWFVKVSHIATVVWATFLLDVAQKTTRRIHCVMENAMTQSVKSHSLKFRRVVDQANSKLADARKSWQTLWEVNLAKVNRKFGRRGHDSTGKSVG
jgi:hypothetical protein